MANFYKRFDTLTRNHLQLVSTQEKSAQTNHRLNKEKLEADKKAADLGKEKEGLKKELDELRSSSIRALNEARAEREKAKKSAVAAQDRAAQSDSRVADLEGRLRLAEEKAHIFVHGRRSAYSIPDWDSVGLNLLMSSSTAGETSSTADAVPALEDTVSIEDLTVEIDGF